MSKQILIFIGVLGVVGLIAAYFVQAPQDGQIPLPEIAQPEPQVQAYLSAPHGISFTYPLGYYLKATEEANGRPELSVVIVEDTQENRDVIEGRATEPRDGPTAITVDVYPNPNRLPAEDWVRADTNWTIRTSDVAPVGRGTLTGVTYAWSGLYEGKSVIVTEGERAYVFSVTWMTPEDPILAAFEQVLSSASLSSSSPTL